MSGLISWLKTQILPSRRDLIMSCYMIVFTAALFFIRLPLPVHPDLGSKEKALVLSVDNSMLEKSGLLLRGSQILQVKVLSGKHKNTVFRAANELRMQMDLDKVFEPGDKVLVAIMHDANALTDTINAQDHYRVENTFLLFGSFALLLMIFGRWTGINALLSFIFSCAVIWKLVIPLCLANVNPLLVTFSAVVVLSVVIILLVAGLTRKGVTALAGSLAGVLASCITGWIFTNSFKINGAVMPYAQTLLHSGFGNLDLSEIFIGAIFLSSSGAVMDLAMDVASGIEELSFRRSDLDRKELFISGMRIGRSVVGTMTTTLLLAYSGGYLTLMMVFTAQGTTPVDFINNPHVASEVVKTLVGSFGLVLVAPFTAAFGAWMFAKPGKDKAIHE